MGKDELWDDSALINAFNHAVSSYKVMHSNKGAKHSTKVDNFTPLDELKSNGEADDNRKVVSDTAKEIADASNLPSVEENHSSQLNEQKTNDKATESISSQSLEDYNQLLNKYYEVEDQRQKILQQLNQYGNWSYQDSGSTSQEHQAYAAQTSYPTESSFYCPYGCQSWVSSCTALPCCLGGNQDDKQCDASLQTVQHKSSSVQKPKLVNVAMGAAEKALSSLKQSSNTAPQDSFAKEEQTAGLETDLKEVLTAWYSAGFYTGKYLAEQSKK